MSLPIESKPPVLVKQLKHYKKFFSSRQFEHFNRLIIGIIVSQNSTLQEINDLFGETNQSSFNRFATESKFDLNELNSLMLKQVTSQLSLKKSGILIIDESLKHKTGRKMELAGAHRSGITKRIEWGHMAVNAIYSDMENNIFPVSSRVFVRECDCEKNGNIKFKTKREIAIEQVDFARENELNIELVLADAGYDGVEFCNQLKSRGVKFAIGTRSTTKISWQRKKRISILEYTKSLDVEKDFKKLIKNKKIYQYHVKQVIVRGIGKLKLIISKLNGEDEFKYYFTNLETGNANIIKLLIKRWEIECFHRGVKQHLGFESYQIRKGRGLQVVALAILIAYTQIVLLKKNIFQTLTSSIKTVGEYCRYMGLIAFKGIKWIKRRIKKGIKSFKLILKRFVLVKTAKV